MALSFAIIRFFAVIRQTVKAPLALRCPQKWVKPKNVKVSGFPSPRCFRSRAANRPNSISLVLSGWSSKPHFASRPEKFLQEPLSIRSVLKTKHKIVSVANDGHVPFRHFLAPGLGPQIEDIMQVHVGG